MGILPKFPITLGGRTIYIDVVVCEGVLGFSVLLGCDYIYLMGALVSSLFHVLYFPHNGRIVTIDQLSFFSHLMIPILSSSHIGSFSHVMPSLPHVNYVATYFVSTMSVGKHVDGLIHHMLGASEPDLSLVPNDIHSSHIVVPPSSEYLLGIMFSYGP